PIVVPSSGGGTLARRFAKGTVMPFECKHVTTTPNRSFPVTFDNVIISYLPALSYYSLSFGDNDHQVQRVALRLEVTMPSKRELSITVRAVLQDTSGHTISNERSTVTVSVLAFTGASPGGVLLAPVNDIPNERKSEAITLPTGPLSTFQTALAGFNL